MTTAKFMKTLGEKLLTKKGIFFLTFLFLLTMKSHRTFVGQGDEPHYVIIAESLYLDRDLDVSNNYYSPWQVPIHHDDHHSLINKKGIERPIHTIGLPLLWVPVYAFTHTVQFVGEKMGFFKDRVRRFILVKNSFSVSMMICASFFAVFLFHVFLSFTDRPKFAWAMAFLSAVSPPLSAYGMLFFTDMPLAILNLVLFWWVMQKKNLTLLPALILGYLPWIHPRSILFAGVYLLFFFWHSYQNQKKNPGAAPFNHALFLSVIPVFMWGSIWFFNWTIWGFFSYVGGYEYLAIKTTELKHLPVALPGLFFDRGFGLFFNNPLYLFSIGGFLVLFKKNKFLALLVFGVISAAIAPASLFVYWSGGWAPPPRYLVVIAPLLSLLIFLFFNEISKGRMGRVFTKIVIGVIFVISLLYWQKPRMLWNYEGEPNRFLVYWLGDFGKDIQVFFPNFFSPEKITYVVSGAVLLFALLLCLGLLARTKKELAHDSHDS